MIKEIDTQELKEMIDSNNDFHLVETLMESDYNKWHLPGAINIHFKKIGEAARNQFSEDDTVVLYCHDENCNASPLAAKKLDSLGFNNIYHYSGGKKAWKEAGMPIENGAG